MLLAIWADSDVHFFVSADGVLTPADLPDGWGSGGYISLEYDLQRGETWAIGTYQLARLTADGWETIDLPANWVPEDFARQVGFHATGLYLAGRNQLALLVDGNWLAYQQDELPLDSSPISDIGLDENGILWITHTPANVVESVATNLLTTGLDDPSLTPTTSALAYPNPAQQGQTTLVFTGLSVGENYRLHLISPDGRLLREESLAAVSGEWRGEVSLTGLPAGLYWYQLLDQGGQLRALVSVMHLQK